MHRLLLLIFCFPLFGCIEELQQIKAQGYLPIKKEWEHHLFHQKLFNYCDQNRSDEILELLQACDHLPIYLTDIPTTLRLNLTTEISLVKDELPIPCIQIEELESDSPQQIFEGVWKVLQECFYIGGMPLLDILDFDVIPLIAKDEETVVGICWLTETESTLELPKGEQIQATVICLELGGRRADYPHAKIGAKFVSEIVGRGYRFAFLFVEADNTPAIQIYEHYGWKKVTHEGNMIEMRIDWENKEEPGLPFEFISQRPHSLWQQVKT